MLDYRAYHKGYALHDTPIVPSFDIMSDSDLGFLNLGLDLFARSGHTWTYLGIVLCFLCDGQI